MKKKFRKVRYNWYGLLYQCKDNRLVSYFWRWYNSHKIKSKNRAARCVLIRYYSTTPAPGWLIQCFQMNRDIKVASYNWLEDSSL